MSSLKKNFIYNFILLGGSYLMAFAVFPYISRVLGPENVGIVNFIDSTIEYFMILSMMGMSTVGVREIAANRNSPHKLNEVFSSLFFVNFIFTFLAISVLVLAYIFLPNLSKYPDMVFVGIIKLIFNFLLLEWVFRGLEDFKYISIRSLIIKFIYFICVFIFVRHNNDYLTYYILLTGMTVVNAIVNWRYATKKFHFNIYSPSWKIFIKPFVLIGLYSLCIGMYSTFNVMFLGMVSTESEVGYYTTSLKLFAVIIGVYYSFTSVALPRMSHLLANSDTEEFNRLINLTANILISVSVPLIFTGISLAPNIIYIIGGPEYAAAVLPLIIIFPLLLVIGYNKILIDQILMPFRKDSSLLNNALICATITILLNAILVKRFGAIGSAIVWVVSELTLLTLSLRTVSTFLYLKFPTKILFKQILSYLPLCILIYIIKLIICDIIVEFIVGSLFAIMYVALIQIYYFKDPTIVSIIKKATHLFLKDNKTSRFLV